MGAVVIHGILHSLPSDIMKRVMELLVIGLMSQCGYRVQSRATELEKVVGVLSFHTLHTLWRPALIFVFGQKTGMHKGEKQKKSKSKGSKEMGYFDFVYVCLSIRRELKPRQHERKT